MKYKLVWKKRVEKGIVHKAGDIVDLSHYSKEERAELVRIGQYEEVPEPAKAAKV